MYHNRSLDPILPLQNRFVNGGLLTPLYTDTCHFHSTHQKKKIIQKLIILLIKHPFFHFLSHLTSPHLIHILPFIFPVSGPSPPLPRLCPPPSSSYTQHPPSLSIVSST